MWARSGGPLNFQVDIRFVVRSLLWNHEGPHARVRARVTVATRLCTRVDRSVWLRIGNSSCRLGISDATLAVTAWT